MGKMHDRLKQEKTRQWVLPRTLSLANSTIIQQLGLDTEYGVQRLLQLMLNKLDPEGKGIRITLDDINNAVEQAITHGRQYFLIAGRDNGLDLKMGTAEEAEAQRKEQEALAAALAAKR